MTMTPEALFPGLKSIDSRRLRATSRKELSNVHNFKYLKKQPTAVYWILDTLHIVFTEANANQYIDKKNISPLHDIKT